MTNNDTRIDKFYDRIESKRANGLLYMFFLWLVAFNPIMVLLTGFPVNDFMTIYLPMFGHEWYLAARPVIIALLCILAIAGIILGIGINLLKKTAWKFLKIYLPFLQALYLALLIPAFPLLEAARAAGYFKTERFRHDGYLATFISMIIASSIIFILLFLYVMKSKKAKAAIFHTPLELD